MLKFKVGDRVMIRPGCERFPFKIGEPLFIVKIDYEDKYVPYLIARNINSSHEGNFWSCAHKLMIYPILRKRKKNKKENIC